MNIFMGSQRRNGFQEAIHKWKVKHHHIEIDLLLLWIYYLLPWQLPLSFVKAATHWQAASLLIYIISKSLSHGAEWQLHICYQPDPFSSSAEEGPYNKGNVTKRLLFSPEKGMKLLSENWGSMWHPSKADLLLKEIHGFVINKERQIDLLWSESFPPGALPKECTRNHCIKRNDLCKTSQFWARKCGVVLHEVSQVAYLKLWAPSASQSK